MCSSDLPNNSIEPPSLHYGDLRPTRPAAANRLYDWFQELAGRLIHRMLRDLEAVGRPTEDILTRLLSFPTDSTPPKIDFVAIQHRNVATFRSGRLSHGDSSLLGSHSISSSDVHYVLGLQESGERKRAASDPHKHLGQLLW